MYLRRHRLQTIDITGLFLSQVVLPRNELIHLHGEVWLWPELWRRPAHSEAHYVYTLHWLPEAEDYAEEELPLISWYDDLIVQACRQSDVVIAVSHWISNLLDRKGIDATVLPPGIDADAIRGASPERFSERYKVPSGFLLWTGYLYKIKRPEWIWRLARELPDERIVAVVADSSPAILREMDLYPVPNNLTMLPYLPHQDFLDAVSSAKVFLSTTRKEAYGIAVGEAIACGTRAVASQLGGPRGYIVPGLTGELFDPSSFDHFVGQVQRAIDRGRVEARATAAFLEEHSDEKVVSRLDSIYSSLQA